MEQKRVSSRKRITKETNIDMQLNLDGEGLFEGSSGVPFFDHMLTLLAKHGRFNLNLLCKGDIEVDAHHTVEDIGIVLGELLTEALGDKRGIGRYGDIILPMDEALILCAVDMSGRPFLNYDVQLTAEQIGMFDTELAEEFMRAFAMSAKINLHLMQLAGSNTHHIIEGCFKALARSLRKAVAVEAGSSEIPSSKGML
jgi:imidazoleglycerol-phosphate dehydratase